MIAVCFDFDGTMVDTEAAELFAWQEVERRFGVRWLADHVQHAISVGPQHDPGELSLRVAVEAESWAGEVYHHYRKTLLQSPFLEALRPGVLEALEVCREIDAHLSICSSSSYAWIGWLLLRFDLLDRFEVVVTRDSWERNWSKRDAYHGLHDQLAAHGFDRFVAVEDSRRGFLAAQEGGWDVIAFPHSITKDQLPICIDLCIDLRDWHSARSASDS